MVRSADMPNTVVISIENSEVKNSEVFGNKRRTKIS